MQIPNSKRLILTTLFSLGAIMSTSACDVEESESDSDEFRCWWDDVNFSSTPEAAEFTECTGLSIPASVGGLSADEFEVFAFSLEDDAFALTSATGGLLAPFPAGIDTFDEPAIAAGAFAGTKIGDACSNLVGFGSEQQLLDSSTGIAQTTYSLTLPNRGTLMLDQEENFGPIFAEVNDMVATGQFVRNFSPPLVVVTTSPGSGKVIGGTDEFADFDDDGVMAEIDYIYQIDLVNGTADILDVLVVGYDDD